MYDIHEAYETQLYEFKKYQLIRLDMKKNLKLRNKKLNKRTNKFKQSYSSFAKNFRSMKLRRKKHKICFKMRDQRKKRK